MSGQPFPRQRQSSASFQRNDEPNFICFVWYPATVSPCGRENRRLASPPFAPQRLNHRVARLLRNEKKLRTERRDGEARRKRREKEGAAGKCGA